MGWSTSWFSEIEPYACRVLEKNFPGVPNLGDITKITSPPPVDILAGGFPCQDISHAGKGAGITGARSGLWKEYARLIDTIRPRYVVAENVSALRSRGLDTVLQDLDALGYDATWNCIPASYLGAAHQRDRIWIVAYAHGEGLQGIENARSTSARGTLTTQFATGLLAQCRAMAIPAGRSGGVHDGVSCRVDRLRCLGNAIVPQVAHLIFQAIAAREAACATA